MLTLSATSAFAAGPDVLKNARHDTSRPLAQMAAGAGVRSQQPDREMAEPRATRAVRNLFRFHADFATPAASTFSGPVLIDVAGYNEICARATTVACIPEPEPGEKVDGLADRVMFGLAYHNFGDHEALVANHTVLGGALGAVRWYEIRQPGSTPTVFQQGTIVDPDTDFWLGSIAMDRAGNIAVGFHAMSKSDFSSVYVAGRKPSDPRGAMFGPLRLAVGSGVPFNSFKRWGDYSSMTVDPKDDCTFWFTEEYYIASGSFNWATHVGAFKFDNCKPGRSVGSGFGRTVVASGSVCRPLRAN